MNDFDKELSRIFNELLTNVSRYDDWNAKGREMVKQAVDKYVIGEDYKSAKQGWEYHIIKMFLSDDPETYLLEHPGIEK